MRQRAKLPRGGRVLHASAHATGVKCSHDTHLELLTRQFGIPSWRMCPIDHADWHLWRYKVRRSGNRRRRADQTYQGVCTGKNSVANFLVKEHCFRRIAVDSEDGKWPKPSPEDHDIFPNLESMLQHVTKRWDRPWVIATITDEQAVEILSLKPFFMLVSIDAPVTLRWQRYLARCKEQQVEPPSLEDFVRDSDKTLYNPASGLAQLTGRAQLRLLNSFSSHADFIASLNVLRLTDEQRFRPSWDEYFMQLADLAAQRSNCMKRRVGCVLVREKRVISTGYNGTPRNVKNCNQGGCESLLRVSCYALLMHSKALGATEPKEVVLAWRHVSASMPKRTHCWRLAGIGSARVLCYTATRECPVLSSDSVCLLNFQHSCPCLTCTVKIAQVGISEVIYSYGYSMDGQAAAVLKEAGIQLRQYSPVCFSPFQQRPKSNILSCGTAWWTSQI